MNYVLSLLALAALLLSPGAALAYVGPGAGFAFVTSFFLLLSTLLLALLALLTWPFRLLLGLLLRRRPPGRPLVDRLVVVGLDGLDPREVRRLLDQGKLPSFKRVVEQGGLGELATTCPALSPVAWSTFATGVDPSRHGLFDFLTRSRTSYTPILSSAEILPPRRTLRLGPLHLPLGRPRLRLLRRSVPFWNLLGRHGIRSSVLRVPITFPPERFRGTLLSAMCVPDLLGTQGSFSYFTSEPEKDRERRIGGRVIQVAVHGRTVRTRLPGPPHPLLPGRGDLGLDLTLTLDPEHQTAVLKLDHHRVRLAAGRYSDWLDLRFRAVWGLALHGLCRFRLISVEPLRLYASPINIDPGRPSLPIAHPFIFSVFLSRLVGRFATLGLAEDTWALNEGVLDELAFIEQVQLCHEERERMFFEMLRRTRRGLCTCVFDGTDRIQHMFMREKGQGSGPYSDVIEQTYLQMDGLLGRILDEVDIGDPRTWLLVLSDHGFAPFERGVNLNTWLLQQGYLTLAPGREQMGEYLQGVDWSRTRAFALGLAGIFLNLAGREQEGIVQIAQAADLRAELARGLKDLRDPEREDVPPILRVFQTRQVFSGPYLDDAPDLIVGYAPGYRASWATARGMQGEQIIEDNRRHWSGDHCIDPGEVPGILVSSRPLRWKGARMMDIAPTVLQLFGVPRPAHMTGTSLVEESPS